MKQLLFNRIATLVLLVASDICSPTRSTKLPTLFDGNEFENNLSFKEIQLSYLADLKEQLGAVAKYELKYGSKMYAQFLIDQVNKLDDLDIYLEERQQFISFVEDYLRQSNNLDDEQLRIEAYLNPAGVFNTSSYYKPQDDSTLYELENIITHMENASTLFPSLQPLVDRLKDMQNTILIGTAILKNNSVELSPKNKPDREVQTKHESKEGNDVKGNDTEKQGIPVKRVTPGDIDLDRIISEDALRQRLFDHRRLSEETTRTLQMVLMTKKLIEVIDLSVVNGLMSTFREDEWGPPKYLRYLKITHNFIQQLHALLEEDETELYGTKTRFHRNKRNAMLEELDNIEIPSVQTSKDHLDLNNSTSSATNTTSDGSPAITTLKSSDHSTSNSSAQKPFLTKLTLIEEMYSSCNTEEEFRETSRMIKAKFAKVDFETNYWTKKCLIVKAESNNLNKSKIFAGHFYCWKSRGVSSDQLIGCYLTTVVFAFFLVVFVVASYLYSFRLRDESRARARARHRGNCNCPRRRCSPVVMNRRMNSRMEEGQVPTARTNTRRGRQ